MALMQQRQREHYDAAEAVAAQERAVREKQRAALRDAVVCAAIPPREELPFGGPLPGRSKWYGGLLGGNGCIYGTPTCAEAVLKIDPVAGRVEQLGSLPKGGYKWHGCVVGSDGAIIGIPCNADCVLRVDPADDSVTLHGKGVVKTGRHRSDGKYKFLGGVLGGDGKTYCIPSDSDYVLRVGTGKDPVVENIGRSLENEKWQQNKW